MIVRDRRVVLHAAALLACLVSLAGAAEEPGITVAKEAGMQERMISAIYGIETTGSDDARLSSDKLIDIPVRVTLRVRFAIDNATPEKGTESLDSGYRQIVFTAPACYDQRSWSTPRNQITERKTRERVGQWRS